MSNPFYGDQGHSSLAFGTPAVIDPIAVQSAIQPDTEVLGQVSHDIIQEVGTSPDSFHPDEGGLSGDRLNKMYLSWEQSKSDEMKQALAADQYYHGKQWTEKQMAVHRSRKQPTIWHQHIARQVNTMIGTEQRHRRDPKAFPRTPKHETSSDSVTSALRYVNDKAKFPLQASQASKDFFVRGIGVMYEGAKVNAKGEIEHAKHHVNSLWFFYDPCSVDHSFVDAKFQGIVRWMDEDQAIQLMLDQGNPGAGEMIARLIGGQALIGSSEYSQWGGKYGNAEVNQKWVDPDRRRIRLVEIWYQHRGTWRQAYLVKDVKLHDRVTPFTHEDGVPRQPYNAISCYIDENGMRYGVVKDMIPVQNEINFIHSKITWALQVRQVMYRKGQVADIDKFRKELAKADGVLEYNTEAPEILSMTDQINGLRDLEGQAVTHLQNLGPNASLVGQGEGVEKQSGRAIMARQNAGMTEMAPVYERLREWKLQSYRNDWAIIRQFWRAPKWLRVLDDDEGMEFVGFNIPKVDPRTGQPMLENDVSVLDMDIIIEEGPDVVTMQEEMFNRLAELGNAVPPEVLIELSALPNKEKILKKLNESKAPPPEVIEMQKRMEQLEAILKASEIDKNIATTEKSRADAAHRLMEASFLPAQHLHSVMPDPGAIHSTGMPQTGSVSTQPSSSEDSQSYDQNQMQPQQPADPRAAQAGVVPMPVLLQQFPWTYGEPSHVDMLPPIVGSGPGAPGLPPGGPPGGALNPPNGAASALGTAEPMPGAVPPVGPGASSPPPFDMQQLGQMIPPSLLRQ